MVSIMNSTNNQFPQLTEKDQQNLKSVVDYSSVESVPEIWPIAAQRFGDTIALHNPHAQPNEVKVT